MNYLISMYIDNELSLEEKIAFVERVHLSAAFKGDAISLLQQEKLLNMTLLREAPELPQQMSFDKKRPRLALHHVGLALAACLLLMVSFLFVKTSPVDIQEQVVVAPVTTMQRFVIFQDGIEQAEIAGSFTNWERIPLQRAGESGYWQITLDVPPGEHRYSYILDGKRQLADPTVENRESDDFGAENSILLVEI